MQKTPRNGWRLPALWHFSHLSFAPITLTAIVLGASSARATITVLDYYRMGENDSGLVQQGAVAYTTSDSVGGKTLTCPASPIYSTSAEAATAVSATGSRVCLNMLGGAYGTNSVLSTVTDNFGIEAWVNPASLSGNPILVYNGNTGSEGWGIVIQNSNYEGLFGGVVYVGSLPATVNAWAHVALVRNNGTNTLYVNGVVEGTSTAAPNPPSGMFAVGAPPQSPNTQFFNGLVDEVRVFTFGAGQFATNDLLYYAGAPTAMTVSSIAVGSVTAALDVNVLPHGLTTTVSYQYGTTTSYGSTLNVATNAGYGSEYLFVSTSVTGLSPATTYHYRGVAANSAGTNYGGDISFTTGNAAPTVNAAMAVNITTVSASLTGSANPNGLSTTGDFQWGLSPGYGNTTPVTSLGAGNSAVTVSNNLTGLAPGTVYHYQLQATSVYGTYDGPDQTFTTLGVASTPIITNLSAVNISPVGASLTGTVNPAGLASAGYFQWGPTTSYGNATPLVNLGSGLSAVTVSNNISGLVPGSVYHYQFQATNSLGTSVSLDQTFKTLGVMTNTAGTGLPSLSGALALWGDYDNDGNLDLLLVGNNGISNSCSLWHNNGNGTFTQNTSFSGLPGVYDAAAAWGDYDNDGNLDFIVTGYTNGSSVPITQVWHNNGNGTFTLDAGAGITGMAFGSVAWGDYDNDGKPDLALSGYNGTNYVFQIWHNNGNGGFSLNPNAVLNSTISTAGLRDGSVAWGDFDSDGYLDLLVAGQAGGVPVCQVLWNLGNGTFTNINAGLTGVWRAAVAWGDYDNDGKLDVLLAGASTNDAAGSPTNPVCQIWHSQGGGVFTNLNAALPGVMSGSVAWGDYDNDGMPDLLLTGITNGGTGAALSQLWHNSGGVFTNSTVSLPGVGNGSAAWGDFNNDGRLDFVLAGSGIGQLWQNQTPVTNTAPTAPTGLQAVVTSLHSVVLVWLAGGDATTPTNGLTYNVSVGTNAGGTQVLAPLANLVTGLRRLPALGNGQQRLFLVLTNLTLSATNYWSVQAVDSTLAASPFATAQFYTNNVFVNPIAPSATTLAAFSGALCSNEVLYATANANGIAATVSFQYGLTTNYGSVLLVTNLPASTNLVSITATLGGLTTGTLYHYRVVAANPAGPIAGADLTFTTRNADNLNVRAYYRMAEMDGTNYQAATPGSQAMLLIDGVAGHNVPVITPATYGDSSITAQPVYSTDVAPSAAYDAGSSGSLNFINGNAYAMAPVFYPGTGNFCLEAWVKASTLSGFHFIIYNGSDVNGWGLSQNGGSYCASTRTYLWANYTGEDFGYGPASLTQWTHVALVSNGGSVIFYVNGIPSGSPAHPLNLQGGNFTIGKGDNFSFRFSGQLDEVRLSTFPAGQFSVTNMLLKSIPPAVSNPTDSAITATSAVLGGKVTGQGGTPVTQSGFVYSVASVNASPTIGGVGVGQVTAPGTTGQITAPVTGLLPSTIYAFAPYAINTFGPVYGPVTEFSTAFPAFTPVVYFRMGESDPGAQAGGRATNTFDSVGTNVLTLTGSPVYSTDTASNQPSTLSLNFGSGTNAGSCPLLPGFTDDFGFEVWVKATADSGSSTILYNGNGGSSGWGLVQNGGTYEVLFGGIVAFGSGPVTLNQWTHLAVVRDGGVATFYVNGVASGTNTSAPNAPAGNFTVGTGWNGLIDEIRLFGFPAGTFTTADLLLKEPGMLVQAPAGTNLLSGGTQDFGTPLVGESSELTFSILNDGNTNLTGLAVAISGTNASEFSVVTNPAVSVAGGGSTTFTVRFTPASAGTQKAALQVSNNDQAASPFNLSLTAGDFYPQINVALAAGTAITNGGSQNFGTLKVGTNTTLTFVIKNLGNVSLLLTSAPPVVVSGPNASEFVVTAQPVQPTNVISVSVTNASFETPVQGAGGFTYGPGGGGWNFGSSAGVAANGSPWYVNPAPDGLQAAYIQINNAGSAISQTVSFPGPGYYAINFYLVRRGPGNAANDIAVSMDGATLGTVYNTSQPDDVWRSFSIPYNCPGAGNHTLAFTGLRAGGDYDSALDDVQVTGVAPTTFQVSFAPVTGGLQTASLSIANNDPYLPLYSVNLSGTGIAPVAPVINAASLTLLANGAFQFTFSNTNNLPFSVITTTDVSQPATNWTVLGTATNRGSGLYQFVDTAATNSPQRYYQLRFP